MTTSARAASDVGRELVSAADVLLRSLENLEDDEAAGVAVDREMLVDIQHALGVFDQRLPVLAAHLRRVVLRLNDRETEHN